MTRILPKGGFCGASLGQQRGRQCPGPASERFCPRPVCPGTRHQAVLPPAMNWSRPAGQEQLRTMFSFLSPQTCLTSALQTPAVRRGLKSAKTSWATSSASAELAGGAGSATEVRPPQPWDRAEGVGIGTSPKGHGRAPRLGRLCPLPFSFPCPTRGHSLLWLTQEWGAMEVPPSCPDPGPHWPASSSAQARREKMGGQGILGPP